MQLQQDTKGNVMDIFLLTFPQTQEVSSSREENVA